MTARFLATALADKDYLTPETLRSDYLAGGGEVELPAPIDDMMVLVATLFLVGLDIGFRITRWLRTQNIDWDRVMAVIAGQQGRPTAGVTWHTSSAATTILGASGHRLSLERMYLAPHAPTFPTPTDGDLTEVIALEDEYDSQPGDHRAHELGQVDDGHLADLGDGGVGEVGFPD